MDSEETISESEALQESAEQEKLRKEMDKGYRSEAESSSLDSEWSSFEFEGL
jgi:hypothetical protein